MARRSGERGAGDGLTVRPASARSSGSVYDLQAVVFDEVLEILHIQRGERQSSREATGRDPGVVRWPRPTAHLSTGLKFAQVRATASEYGSTSSWDMNPRRSSVRRGPQCWTSVHLVSSPIVTNVTAGVRPASRAASGVGTRPRNIAEATSVSTTTKLTRRRRAATRAGPR